MDTVSDNLRLNYFSARIEIEPTDHIKFVTARCHCGTFSWCWHPSLVHHVPDVNSVTFSFLHSLNVGLQTAN